MFKVTFSAIKENFNEVLKAMMEAVASLQMLLDKQPNDVVELKSFDDIDNLANNTAFVVTPPEGSGKADRYFAYKNFCAWDKRKKGVFLKFTWVNKELGESVHYFSYSTPEELSDFAYMNETFFNMKRDRGFRFFAAKADLERGTKEREKRVRSAELRSVWM